MRPSARVIHRRCSSAVCAEVGARPACADRDGTSPRSGRAQARRPLDRLDQFILHDPRVRGVVWPGTGRKRNRARCAARRQQGEATAARVRRAGAGSDRLLWFERKITLQAPSIQASLGWSPRRAGDGLLELLGRADPRADGTRRSARGTSEARDRGFALSNCLVARDLGHRRGTPALWVACTIGWRTTRFGGLI